VGTLIAAEAVDMTGWLTIYPTFVGHYFSASAQ
jgi:hypothetical protein